MLNYLRDYTPEKNKEEDEKQMVENRQGLTWRNDPLLFDPEPLPMNQWLNANALIEAGRGNEIFLDFNSLTLNLLPILIRRSDFVRKKQGDRIIARFPFVELTTEEKELIKSHILLIAEKARDYFYQSYNRSILAWRELLEGYLDRGFLPLPIIRCISEYATIDLATGRNFESARGEAFTMPTKLSEELAYLAGLVNGDGHLRLYVLSIVDYSDKNIEQLKDQFEQIFAQEGRIQFQSPNSPEVIITNKWVVRLFSFLTDQPIGAKKYDYLREPLLFQEEPFRSQYWSGVFDADGSYAKNKITFTSASKRFATDFMQFLTCKGIYSKLIERVDGTFQVYVPKKYHHMYKSIVKCLHPEKAQEYEKLTRGKSREAKFFSKFKEETLVEGYFNFRLLRGLQIVGLGDFIRQARGGLKVKEFSTKLGITERYLRNLEQEINAISIEILEKILELKNKPLMPLLSSFGRSLKFRMRSSFPVHLDFQPNQLLKKIAQGLIFYENLIRLPSENKTLKEIIENHFGIAMQNNLINSKVLRDFFSTFCKFALES